LTLHYQFSWPFTPRRGRSTAAVYWVAALAAAESRLPLVNHPKVGVTSCQRSDADSCNNVGSLAGTLPVQPLVAQQPAEK
jgi:hypothetical protein